MVYYWMILRMSGNAITIPTEVLYVQTGTVGRGSALAKLLGYPTANIHCTHAELSGTYAGYVTIEGMPHRAAVYADRRRHLLKSHIFDFSGNLYGTVTLLKKIADAEDIRDRESLRTHIAEVVGAAREYFRSLHSERSSVAEPSVS